MKRCPTCNRSYTKEDQKFCPQDGTRLEDIEEIEFDPLKTIVATPQPAATAEDRPAPPAAPAPPEPPQEEPVRAAEEEPVEFDARKTMVAAPSPQTSGLSEQPSVEEPAAEFDPLMTMVATPPPSSSSRAESSSLQMEEERAPVEEQMEEPAPVAPEESFDAFKTMMAPPAPRASDPLDVMPDAPSASSSSFDEERTFDNVQSMPTPSEPLPSAPYAEPMASQYAPFEPEPLSTPAAPQATDWGASQQPAELNQQYGAMPQSAVQEKKRKGAARVSMILGLLSLLLVAISGVAGLTTSLAYAIIYPMLSFTGGSLPFPIILRYLIILLIFALPFIGFVLGIYGLIKSWKQPAKFGGKGMALTGILTSLLADLIFFLSLAYLVWTLMAKFQSAM